MTGVRWLAVLAAAALLGVTVSGELVAGGVAYCRPRRDQDKPRKKKERKNYARRQACVKGTGLLPW